MNSHRSHGIAWIWLLTFAACGGGKFSDQFAAEIQTDCLQTFNCQMTGNVQTCSEMAADALNKAAVSQQQFFVDTVSRCAQSTGCNYINCTGTDVVPGSYSNLHLQQITFDCQQTSQCRMNGGQTVAPDAVTTCVSQQGATLDANPAAQAEFEAKFMHCNGFAACSWNTCK
jgi:hypothetical protein